MATLDINVKQVNADFQAIKNKIVEKGVEVADGTKTSEYADKVGAVYEAGVKSESEKLWRAIQRGGERSDYGGAFKGTHWTGDIFKPLYDIKPTLANSMFEAFGSGQDNTWDLAEILNKQGVVLDTSNATGVDNLMRNTSFNHIPEINLTNASQAKFVFTYCKAKTIDKVVFKEDGSQNLEGFFGNCSNLENLTIEGKIGHSGFYVSESPKLTHDSLMSVINALKDYSSDTSGKTYTVYFRATNLAKLTDAEKAMITGKGWTLV